MSYAYYQGQEVQALDYYRKRLESEENPEERKQLERLVASLEKAVEEMKKTAANAVTTLNKAAVGW